MATVRAASLFTGVGGLDLALGVEPVVQVEREPYCLDVLALRWPGVKRVTDVRDYHPAEGSLDLVFGGPPCQPVSHAGRRKGDADDRWLWPEALRVVAEARPATVFFENPMGIRTLGLDGILAELTGLGYGGAWEVVAAADVGAPHLRKRIFIMGVRGRTGWDGPTRPAGNRAVEWATPTAHPRTHTPRPVHHGRQFANEVAAREAAVIWPTPTEAEAASMLNGKSPFAAQGKVPALWPTPHGNTGNSKGGEFDGHGSELSQAVRVAEGLSDSERSARRVPAMPTPSAADGAGGPGTSPHREGGLNLRTYVAAYPAPLWPTPTTRDYKDTGDSIANGTVPVNSLLGRAVEPTRERGALSPDWVCWLMGLPIGWEDITRPEPGPLYGWESEPAIPRVGLGIPNRAKRLTALGNAVVPAQGRFAYHRLAERLAAPQSTSEPEWVQLSAALAAEGDAL